ncbi:MAG TPA: hypothetical protein VHF26_07875, partial [Trebonia sp.]|nr:hypothetical protein [Trebonia sp.]
QHHGRAPGARRRIARGQAGKPPGDLVDRADLAADARDASAGRAGDGGYLAGPGCVRRSFYAFSMCSARAARASGSGGSRT